MEAPEQIRKRGWPKGKPRAEKKDDVYDLKMEFAKSLGYATLSEAFAGITKFEFEIQFNKSSK